MICSAAATNLTDCWFWRCDKNISENNYCMNANEVMGTQADDSMNSSLWNTFSDLSKLSYCYCTPKQSTSSFEDQLIDLWQCASDCAGSIENTHLQLLSPSGISSNLEDSSNNKESIPEQIKEFKNDKDENKVKISLPNKSNSDDESYNVAGLSRHKSASNKQSSAFRFRNDVIFKTIFRSFRKHYIRDFKRHFDFTKNRDQQQLFGSKIREYLISQFGYDSEAMRTMLVCIIDTKQKYIQVGNNQAQISTMVNDIMYSFSTDKMMELIDWAEFAEILKSFLVQDNVINKILKNCNDSDLKKAYRKLIKSLVTMCS